MNIVTSKVIFIALVLPISIENTDVGKFTIHVLNAV